MSKNELNERCHDACKEKGAHSICLMAPTLKRPLLDQMIHRLTSLPNKRQNQKRFAQYLRVEQILKQVAI